MPTVRHNFSCQSAEQNFRILGGVVCLRSGASGGVNTSLVVFVGKQCARYLYQGLSQGD